MAWEVGNAGSMTRQEVRQEGIDEREESAECIGSEK